jgi:hypothetical protein
LQCACACCGKTKPLEDYVFSKKTGRYSRRCAECGPPPNNKGTRHSGWRSLIGSRLHQAKCNSKGKEFSIDKDYLLGLYEKQGGLCAITQVEMTYTKNTRDRNASIDRIDCNVGYVPENIRLVCSAVNIMRNRLEDEELLFWAEAIVKGKRSGN